MPAAKTMAKGSATTASRSRAPVANQKSTGNVKSPASKTSLAGAGKGTAGKTMAKR